MAGRGNRGTGSGREREQWDRYKQGEGTWGQGVTGRKGSWEWQLGMAGKENRGTR